MNFLFTKTPLAFFTQNLWRDEAFSYLMSKLPVLEILSKTAQDFNPPLYYVLLHYWMLLFGSSEVALRSLSLVFFGGTIVVLYEILVKVMKIPVYRALVYLILIAANPFLLSYAFEARMYMMVTFFVTLSYYALWTSHHKVYRIAIVAALYTHYFSVFILAAQTIQKIAPSIIRTLRKKSFIAKFVKKKARHTITRVFKDHLNIFVPALLFFPWVLYLLSKHNFSEGGFWIIKPLVKDILYVPFVLYTGYERVFAEYYHGKAGFTEFHTHLNILIWIIALIPVLYAFLAFLSQNRRIHLPSQLRTTNYKLLSTILWAFFTPVSIFVLSLISTPLYHPRYFIVAVPGLILLLLYSIEIVLSILSHLMKKQKGIIRVIPFAVILIMGCYLFRETQSFNTLNLKYHSKRTVSRMYAEIMSVKKEQDEILLTRDMDYPLALYYTGLDKVRIFNIEYADIPSYVGKVLIPEDVVTFQYPQFPAKAFVIFYDSYRIHSQL